MKALAALSLAAVSICLTACGSSSSSSTGATAATPPPTRTVDDAQVEQGIEQDLSTSSVKVTSASCPSGEQVESGATFTCSLKFSNGATGKAKVTQKGADRYTYEIVPGSVMVPGSVAEAEIQKQLAAEGVPNATVNCPDNIIVKENSKVTCDVSGDKAGGTVSFTFSNTEGTVDPSSVQTG